MMMDPPNWQSRLIPLSSNRTTFMLAGVFDDNTFFAQAIARPSVFLNPIE
jgi:hypothetical protein